MTEPREIELLLPSTHSAGCAVSASWRLATTTLRYHDRQVDACDAHTNLLCIGLKVIDRRRRSE
jgi:hypothetical protein